MQNKKIKIFIIAGEVSGDVLGARIIREMPNAEFVGIGGKNMQDAGLSSIFPMSDLAVMGVVEVLAHARTLMRRIKQTTNAILQEKPDVVLTIDSPGFAKSVVENVRKSPDGQRLISNGLRFHLSHSRRLRTMSIAAYIALRIDCGSAMPLPAMS